MTVHVVLHAHLYQPPREDPWIEEIEGEESARPHADWNERITAECYRPMGASRVLDRDGYVVDIVNTYRHVSFNIGPTLCAWLERRAPAVLEAARAADADSRARLGHGNAIAQAYNHMILPLADRRDKETQVRWGIADFRRRFGRDPEAMWLPETAVDAETAEVLARNGMRFVILAPGQADAVRAAEGEWTDVAGGRIDPRRPYRLRTPAGDLAAFFYDGALAAAVSFQHLLRSGDEFVRRLRAAAGAAPEGEDLLVSVATDGEIYGHHEPFGDMCLAFAATQAGPAAGLRFTNYASYLAAHPPTREVRLAQGPHGEGTSWSCAHGVGRWRRDCGCRTGAPMPSTQAWRTPLRAGLDALRDSLRSVFEREGRKVLRDPWAARDAYVEVVLARHAEAARRRFLDEHLAASGAEAGERALRLLESQRHAMLMYTSCAWFFWDVSGIETVQVMKYAHRALRALGPLAPREAEMRLLAHLAEAKSNLLEQGDGAACYRRHAAPLAGAPARAAFEHAARRLAGDEAAEIHTFAAAAAEWRTSEVEERAAAVVDVRHRATGEAERFLAVVRRGAAPSFAGAVAPLADRTPEPGMLADSPFEEAVVSVADRPGGRRADLSAWFGPERRAAVAAAFEAARPILTGDLEGVFADLLPILEAGATVGVPIPVAFAEVAARALSERIDGAVEAAVLRARDAVGGDAAAAEDPDWGRVREAVHLARRLNLRLDLAGADARLAAALEAMTRRLEAEGLAPAPLDAARCLVVSAHRAGLRPDLARAQEALFRLLATRVEAAVAAADRGDASARLLAETALELAAFANLRTDRLRARLTEDRTPR